MSSSTSSSSAAPGSVTLRRIGWVVLLVLCAAAILRLGSFGLSRLARGPEWREGDARVLFLGSSHVHAGVEPSLFARPAGVLAFAGMNLELGAAALRAHRQLWPALETVVVEVDEFTLLLDSVKLRDGDLTHLCDRLDLSVWELPGGTEGLPGLRRSVTSVVRGDGWALLGPEHRLTLGRLRRELVGPGRFFSQPESARSWARQDSPLTAELAARRVRFLQGRALASGKAGDRNLAALVGLARWLAEQGVLLALVSLPKHETYLRARPPEWGAAVRAAVRAVREGDDARSALPEVPWWNLERDPRFTDAEFGNQDHLNAAGARELASRLEALLAALPPGVEGELAAAR